MANIALHSDSSNSATSVSNFFIDEYMADANGEFVKIYLYLLRLLNQPGADFSISSIADKFDHTEKDVRRALNYWERMHLLRLEYDNTENLTGVCMLSLAGKKQQHSFTLQVPPKEMPQPAPVSNNIPFPSAEEQQEDASFPLAPAPYGTDPAFITAPKQYGTDTPLISSPALHSADVPFIPAPKQYSADDISGFQNEECVAELFFITERYLGRTLNVSDINTILYLYDGVGLAVELIEYLIEYCVSKGHTSIRYIEKTGLAWAKNNIHTVEEAKRSLSVHNQTSAIVQKAFGIKGRSLVPTETEFIEKWKNTYGFSNDLILNACCRTMTATHQPSFEYTDKILSNWHRCQVKNTEDIAKLDRVYQSRKKPSASASPVNAKNRFNNFNQRTYDYNQLEKMLLTTDAQ